MKTLSQILCRLQLLGLITSTDVKSYSYQKLEEDSIILDNNGLITNNSKIYGIKLVYRKYTTVPRILHLLGLRINLFPKRIKEEVAIFYRPLKKYWPKDIKIPYEILGKQSDPYLGRWLLIKGNFNDAYKDIIQIKEILNDKELSKYLNSKSSKFSINK